MKEEKAAAMRKVVADERRCQGVIVQCILNRLDRVVRESTGVTSEFTQNAVLSAVSGVSFDLRQGDETIRVDLSDMTKWSIQPEPGSRPVSRLVSAPPPRANVMRQDAGKGAPCVVVGKLGSSSGSDVGDLKEMTQSKVSQ